MTSTEIHGGGYLCVFSVNIWKLEVHWASHLNPDWMQWSSCLLNSLKLDVFLGLEP
jgi:hypothetical protein